MQAPQAQPLTMRQTRQPHRRTRPAGCKAPAAAPIHAAAPKIMPAEPEHDGARFQSEKSFAERRQPQQIQPFECSVSAFADSFACMFAAANRTHGAERRGRRKQMQTIKIAGERINLLTLQETARALNVSERTARQYLRDGLIPSCKVKRRLFVTDRNLALFLKGARSTRRKPTIPAPKYEIDDFPADAWEE